MVNSFSLLTRYSVTIPDAITTPGIAEIQSQITAFGLPQLPVDWDWRWVIQKGKFAGTFPKRVARYYHKEHGKSLPETFLSELGNIARRHSSGIETFNFDFTDKFDWKDGDFGDFGSCYWGSRSAARNMLSENGGLAIRFYNDVKGIARAWILPRDPVYIVFNGYGYDTLKITRIFSEFIGGIYKQISLSNWGDDGGTLWINGGNGYVSGKPADVENTPDEVDFEIGSPKVCYSCGCAIFGDDDSYYGLDDECYCQDCYYEIYDSCEYCGETYYRDDLTYVESAGVSVCDHCLDRRYTCCATCDSYFRNDDVSHHEKSDAYYCVECYPADPENEEQE